MIWLDIIVLQILRRGHPIKKILYIVYMKNEPAILQIQISDYAIILNRKSGIESLLSPSCHHLIWEDLLASLLKLSDFSISD